MASLSTTLTSGCYENQSCIIATLIRDAPGAPGPGSYSWTVIDQATNIDYGGPVEEGNLASLPNGVYKVRIRATYPDGSGAASILHTVQVMCATSTPAPDSITVNWAEPSPPPALGYAVNYRLKGSTDPYVVIFVAAPPYTFTCVRGYLYEGKVVSRCSDTDLSTGAPFTL